MANRKLVAIVTALMLSVGGQGAHAAYTLNHLVQIEHLIVAGQWEQLRAFLAANPFLLEGDGALATELRRFLTESAGGTIASIVPAALPRLATVAAAKDSY